VERYGGNMEEKDCWNKFVISGKVEDYLEYCNSVEHATHNKMAGTQASLIFTTKPDVHNNSSAKNTGVHTAG